MCFSLVVIIIDHAAKKTVALEATVNLYEKYETMNGHPPAEEEATSPTDASCQEMIQGSPCSSSWMSSSIMSKISFSIK